MMKTLTDLHHPELPMMKLLVMIKHLLLICQHLTQILDQTVLVSTMKKSLDLMEPVSMMKKVLDLMDLSMLKTLTDLDHPDLVMTDPHPLDLMTTGHHLMMKMEDPHPLDQMTDLHSMTTILLNLLESAMMVTPNLVSTTLM